MALDELLPGTRLERNVLVAALLNALHAGLRTFADTGWRDFLPAWRRYDYLADRPVAVTRGSETLQGIARGIADDGSLRVEAAWPHRAGGGWGRHSARAHMTSVN